jgi:hypothetical protein
MNRKRILYYKSLKEAEDAFAYWLDLSSNKRPALETCLRERLKKDASGRLFLGPFDEMGAVIWYWKNGNGP